MRLISSIVLVSVIVVGAAIAQKNVSSQKNQAISGYLVDRMCAKSMLKQGPEKAMEKAKRHTRECAFHEDCAASGFGVMSEGKLIPFDEAGDKKAMAYLKSITKERAIEVVVSGVFVNEKFKVNKIEGK